MSKTRKAAVALAALVSFGAFGIAAPAHAYDTNWPCAGCAKAGR